MLNVVNSIAWCVGGLFNSSVYKHVKYHHCSKVTIKSCIHLSANIQMTNNNLLITISVFMGISCGLDVACDDSDMNQFCQTSEHSLHCLEVNMDI